MWNKRPDEGPGPRQQTGVQPTSPSQTHTQAPVTMQPRIDPTPRQPVATIGASMHIKGEIRTAEELVVDGEVEGSLESQSVVSIGKNGKVRANIKAREVHVIGSLRGNVEVSGKISIQEQGSLVGDIKAAGISIDDGAYFKGSIDITRPPKAVEAKAG